MNRYKISDLETIRKEYFELDRKIGVGSSYLDYGKPNENQKLQTEQAIVQFENEKVELEIMLERIMQEADNEQKDIINQWIAIHIEMLTEKLPKTEPDVEPTIQQKVMINLINQTIDNWKTIKQTKKPFLINFYYLKDYNQWFDEKYNK